MAYHPLSMLNALRAFESAARHLSFTRAGLELRVTQAAVSHQVKNLERQLGKSLFRRLPRGLALTDEGLALVPTLSDAFARIGAALDRVADGHIQEVVTVGCVGTFATGWLLARLSRFQAAHPLIDLRLLTNNNRVDIAGDALDFAIRFGDGSWHGTEAEHLFDAPLTPFCAPELAVRLGSVADLARAPLLRSYRPDEWPLWFASTGSACPLLHGPLFDSSVTMAEAAALGMGVALLPARLFEREVAARRLARPFLEEIATGAYWLTYLKTRTPTPGMGAFRDWLEAELRR